jgi:hypothetical protein
MARRVPVHWFTSSARPLEPEPPETISPTLDLAAVGESEADGPQPFGRKSAWLAIRSSTTASVLEALGIVGSVPCGWARGLAIAGREPQVVFLTPPVRGWTLVLGPQARFHDEAGGVEAHLAWLRRLSRRLGEVQYFASQRTVAYFCWSRARDGDVVRSYCYSEGTRWRVGPRTVEEHAAGAGAGGSTPDEDTVLGVARRWSVDPDELTASAAAPSRGTLGLLPPTEVHVHEPSAYQRRYAEEVPAPAAQLQCRVHWNPAALRLAYEFEPISSRTEAGGAPASGGRRRVGEHEDVPRIVQELRAALGRPPDGYEPPRTGSRRRKGAADAKPLRARGDAVVVEVEQLEGALRFWPTRRRWGRLRRHEPGRIECRWVDRSGIVAWSLDEAIVRSLRLRPLWRILVELGQG